MSGRGILCSSGILTLLILSLARTTSAAECIPFEQADRHIGERQCVTGKVVRVEQGARGVHYLDFCEDYRSCPFSVVVFSSDLKRIGDLRPLTGKVIQIRGEIQEYDDRAEIILENARQLGGTAAKLPALPRNFDVEQRGRFSAGRFHASHGRSTRKKRQQPTLPIDVESD